MTSIPVMDFTDIYDVDLLSCYNSLYAICNDSVMAELIVSCSQTLYEANTNTFIPTDELYIKSIALKKPCLIQIPAKICLGLCEITGCLINL